MVTTELDKGFDWTISFEMNMAVPVGGVYIVFEISTILPMPFDGVELLVAGDDKSTLKEFYDYQYYSSEKEGVNNEVCSGEKCSGYRGFTTKTRGGLTCKAWDVDKEANYTPQKFPNAGLEKNFCRNPNPADGDTIWCYTVDPATDWQYCDPTDFDRLVVKVDSSSGVPTNIAMTIKNISYRLTNLRGITCDKFTILNNFDFSKDLTEDEWLKLNAKPNQISQLVDFSPGNIYQAYKTDKYVESSVEFAGTNMEVSAKNKFLISFTTSIEIPHYKLSNPMKTYMIVELPLDY